MMDNSVTSIAVGDDIKPYKIHVSQIKSRIRVTC
jgi:hypothetical protein